MGLAPGLAIATHARRSTASQTKGLKLEVVKFTALQELKWHGSKAAPDFMNPEGIVIFHTAANVMFKVTLEGDEKPKGSNE